MGSVRCKNINPEILRWARKAAGYKLADVSKNLDLEKLKEWEQGKDYPTYDQLEKLAFCYERPLVLFLFSEVPEEKNIKHSFRALLSGLCPEHTAFINRTLRKGEAFRLRLHELTNGVNPAKNLITDTIKGRYYEMKELAKKTRAVLGISVEEQKTWGSLDTAFKNWRTALAVQGIFVLRDPFKDWIKKNPLKEWVSKNPFKGWNKEDKFSGFCIYDKQFPVIVVNDHHPVNRQIFTLFHELAHLILMSDQSDKEEKCDEFASEFLLPASDLANEVKQRNVSLDVISQLANLYCVSREAVSWKMYKEGIIDIDRNTFAELLQAIKNSPPPKQQEDTCDTLYTQKIAQLGKFYIELVLQKYSEEQITLGEAANFLYIAPTHFDQLEDEFRSDK